MSWPSSCIANRQMLPSSHLALMDSPRGGAPVPGRASLDAAPRTFKCSSNQVEGSEAGEDLQLRSAAYLAGEFSEFISAAARLEEAYRELQREVSALNSELAERNNALSKSLAENQQMRLALQQIVESMPCGVLVLDQEGMIVMINPESKRMLGLEQTALKPDSGVNLRSISDLSGIDLQSCFESASYGDMVQEMCIQGSPDSRWIEVSRRRIFLPKDPSELPDQTILILRDITAQKRAEQLRETGRKAMALAELTTILAHEIRNPLASLELFAELIEKDVTRSEEWISNLRAGVRSLSGTVNNVLSFHGSGSLAMSPVTLPGLLANALRFVQPMANLAEVVLKLEISEEAVSVMANANALQQVALNLLSNAIRHTPSGGTITVSLQREPLVINDAPCIRAKRFSVVEFSDTGCGISADLIDHIFEPGFSGTGDTPGLGLAVCARIIREHGGRILARNHGRSGAVFTLHLPVLDSERAKP